MSLSNASLSWFNLKCLVLFQVFLIVVVVFLPLSMLTNGQLNKVLSGCCEFPTCEGSLAACVSLVIYFDVGKETQGGGKIGD